MSIYQELLYRPILNLLVFFYNFTGENVGLAIIAVTLLIRLILYPSFRSSIKSQKALQELQPKIEEAKAKHKDNQQEQMQAIMGIYKEHKVSPFSSCLPILIQLPVLLALFQVLNNQLPKATIEGLYSFVSNPGSLNPMFLGLNLAHGNTMLAAIASILQFFQTKMLQPKTKPGVKMEMTANLLQKQMLYFLPAMTFLISIKLPAGLPLYWAVTTLFAIGQQWFMVRARNAKGAS